MSIHRYKSLINSCLSHIILRFGKALPRSRHRFCLGLQSSIPNLWFTVFANGFCIVSHQLLQSAHQTFSHQAAHFRIDTVKCTMQVGQPTSEQVRGFDHVPELSLLSSSSSVPSFGPTQSERCIDPHQTIVDKHVFQPRDHICADDFAKRWTPCTTTLMLHWTFPPRECSVCFHVETGNTACFLVNTSQNEARQFSQRCPLFFSVSMSRQAPLAPYFFKKKKKSTASSSCVLVCATAIASRLQRRSCCCQCLVVGNVAVVRIVLSVDEAGVLEVSGKDREAKHVVRSWLKVPGRLTKSFKRICQD